MSGVINGVPGPLRRVLEAACGPGIALRDLTVLAVQNDPYRVDIPAGHRDGQWFAEQLARLNRTTAIHLRGLHYAIVAAGNVLKPNRQPYVNTDENWLWLQDKAADAARWLGYVPFDRIIDARNAPPVIHRQEPVEIATRISAGIDIEIPDVADALPRASVTGFFGRQPYHLVIFGEKTSLKEVVLPIAYRFDANLYLPSGEITDSQLHQMAADGAADGRPMRVFTLSDCDPAGWQMPVSVGRKLQALRDLHFRDLDFEVRPIGLTVDQVRELDLPSTPLKDTERRGDRWRRAFGVEQTEIDALATLRPRVLEGIVTQAIAPFCDATLSRRVRAAREKWEEEANAALADQIDGETLARIQAEVANKLDQLREEIEALNERLRVATTRLLELPPVKIPEPEVNSSVHGKPLLSSAWPWAEQTRALIARKAYCDGDRP